MLNLAKRIQALSENGQHYSESDYDLDRYTEMEKIAICHIPPGNPEAAAKLETFEPTASKSFFGGLAQKFKKKMGL